jgi:hypothetical protein
MTTTVWLGCSQGLLAAGAAGCATTIDRPRATSASGGHLSGEQVLRRILRDLSERDQSAGQPVFHAKPGTPSVNGLSETLLFENPNQANPFRIDRTQSYTSDQSHDYTTEQESRNGA